MYQYTSVLTIAGSDSGGGAGIQADLKTFAALGCYGTSAISAVTAQDTLAVRALHIVPADIIVAQILAVMDDIRPAAVKTGLLPDPQSVEAVAAALKPYPHVPLVVDPVMVASTGSSLLATGTLEAMRRCLFPLARLITPNIPEVAALTGQHITDLASMRAAMPALLALGSDAVLIKGGHLPGEQLYSLYADVRGNEALIPSARIQTNNTHGTGCTLSAAIAAGIAKGAPLLQAVRTAEAFVQAAVREGTEVRTGRGAGPLDHFFSPVASIRTEISGTASS